MSSGGSNVMVWQVITSASTAYLSQAEALHAFSPGPGDGGFFTSISSSGEANMILWAVPRSGSQVYLYAFAVTQVAAPGWLLIPSGMQAQLTPTPIFTSKPGPGGAGTWTNANTNANIVPVVANGKVFVASSGQLNIFGILP